MNIIHEKTIFDYMEIEELGDLERFKLFLENIEDKELRDILKNERGNGRNDFPVDVMLNMVYAIKIYGHRSVESFRRELSRNSQLRRVCGLKEEDYLYLGKRKTFIPKARVFTRFFKQLTKHQDILDKIFEKDVKFMYENLENFGVDCALDGKLLDSYAKSENKKRKQMKIGKIIEETMMQVGHVKHIILKIEQVKRHGILDMRHIYYVMQIMDYQYGKN